MDPLIFMAVSLPLLSHAAFSCSPCAWPISFRCPPAAYHTKSCLHFGHKLTQHDRNT